MDEGWRSWAMRARRKWLLAFASKPGQVILAMNAMADGVSRCEVDPAAVFAAATSIWDVCHKRAGDDPALNLSDAYNGMDQLMREVMRIGETFEKWACLHVEF